ncbi:STAS domain-containing protein [Fictibacillus sp. KU28468]|uniref:STAS domain-containing protein n=1 Tax=Fictibacillus sp. KU28468 TaxID=2991053 RepID=UPI00223CC49C|nr:STAS domain-containing protein [Fictibacillus sp. KU28468]UZJ79119.1 STAS domain-containing protein [Fictibacillus sp. KU28468]
MNKKKIQLISERIVEQIQKITERSAYLQMKENPESIKKMMDRKLRTITEEESKQLYEQFLFYLGEALVSDYDTSFQKITKWGEKAGEIAVLEDIPLDESLDGLRFFRQAMLHIIDEEAEKVDLSRKEFIQITSIIDTLLDRCIYSYSIAFVRHNRKKMEVAQLSILELSVPVVPLAKGIAVLPIIGEIDTHRSQMIMEQTLTRCTELQVEQLMIDLSGVAIIDTMVAHNLFQVINSLKLLGVKVVLTGIRPEIAQTVVSLGVSFEGVSVCGSLQQAITMVGFERKNEKPASSGNSIF